MPTAPHDAAPTRPQVDSPVIPSLPSLVTSPGESGAPRLSANRGFYEQVRDSSPDSIPDADYLKSLRGMPTRATIAEATDKLSAWVPAVLGQCSAHRAEIGTPRADVARDLEAAERELAEATAKVRGLESRLNGIDNRTSQLKRHEETIRATAEDLAKTYDGAVTFFDVEAELESRHDALVDQLAAIPEYDREPEDPAEEYLRLSPAQQLARQIRLISRTLKNTQLGFDRPADLSMDYRTMISARFGRPFADCPRRHAIFGAVVREFAPSAHGTAPTGRYGSRDGQIEQIEQSLFTHIVALYRAFPAIDPAKPAAEFLVSYRITAGGDMTGQAPRPGDKVGRMGIRRRGDTVEMVPSEAERINREYRAGHAGGPLRLTPEAEVPKVSIPIPAKRLQS